MERLTGRRLAVLVVVLQLGSGATAELPAQALPVVGNVVFFCPVVLVDEKALETEIAKCARRTPSVNSPLQGSEVRLGTTLTTKRRGRAEVALAPGGQVRPGAVRLGPETQVVFDEFVVGGRLSLRMVFGLLEMMVRPERAGELGPGDYEIRTPKGVLRLRGTHLFVRVDRRDGSTLVAVVEGRVEVESTTGKMVELGPGEWSILTGDEPPTTPAPIPDPHDDLFPGYDVVVDPASLPQSRFNLPR